MSHKECGCPVIDSADWEGKVFNWEGKTFYQEKVSHFFKVPVNVESKMAQAAEIIEERGYMLEEPLMVLVREGTFSGAIYVAILPPEEDAPEVVTFPNSLVEATVFERKESKIGPGIKEFRRKLETEGKEVKDIYLWHLGCPRCNAMEGYKTVIFAELADNH